MGRARSFSRPRSPARRPGGQHKKEKRGGGKKFSAGSGCRNRKSPVQPHAGSRHSVERSVCTVSDTAQVQEQTYGEAIRDATAEVLRKDSRAFLIGLGVPDPKGIFGTTSGLVDEFGSER